MSGTVLKKIGQCTLYNNSQNKYILFRLYRRSVNLLHYTVSLLDFTVESYYTERHTDRSPTLVEVSFVLGTHPSQYSKMI